MHWVQLPNATNYPMPQGPKPGQGGGNPRMRTVACGWHRGDGIVAGAGWVGGRLEATHKRTRWHVDDGGCGWLGGGWLEATQERTR